MRVLHLPHSVGNNAWTLSAAERETGIKSDVMIIDPTPYSNKCDINFRPGNRYFRVFRYMLFCIKARNRYDVIHYNWGSVLFERKKFGLFAWDLKYFKKHGKVIAITFQGSDARQAEYCYRNMPITYFKAEDVIAQAKTDAYKVEKIRFLEKNADLIYATNPDLLHVLPSCAMFRPYTKLWPEEWKPRYSDYSKAKTVILHAPTKQNVKGTAYVTEAIKRLQSEGYDIEFMLLQNIPHDEVMQYYEKADLVIDQLLVGWYGGFAVECMALGKPVMCYLREEDLQYIPAQMKQEMPIIRVTPQSLYDKLKATLDHKQELAQVARASREYIEKWHDPHEIAIRIIQDYQACLDRKRQPRARRSDSV